MDNSRADSCSKAIDATNRAKRHDRSCPEFLAPRYTVLAAVFLIPLALFGLAQESHLSRLLAESCGSADSVTKIVDRLVVSRLSQYAVQNTAPLLQVFQVYPPVFVPVNDGSALTDSSSAFQVGGDTASVRGCVRTKKLVTHVFANSYGLPFVGWYSPPRSCHFNRVILNMTVTSKGRQFDRLGIIYLGDIEIWRTSTAEPTKSGIVWTYTKDLSAYLSLFKHHQKIIFDIGNTVDSTYTGSYHVTLTAEFFTTESAVNAADLILPVSTQQSSSNMPSAYQYPSQNARNSLKFPRNAHKAVFSIAATGQIDEEFWYGNAPSSLADTFGPGFLLGHSPFREVQLYIDDLLAGVVWPFPIIFTGGIVPGFWRPVVGVDAFDIKEDEIDISAWLPILCDGKSHSFQIRVAGISESGNDDGTLSNTEVGNYWVITGKAFIWLDQPKAVTSGSVIQRFVHEPTITLVSSHSKLPNGTNETLTFNVHVDRQLLIQSNVTTSQGTRSEAWTQKLTYTNHGHFSQKGNVQITKQTTEGLDLCLSGYARRIKYPLDLNTSYNIAPKSNDLMISATLNRSQDIYLVGRPLFPSGLKPWSKSSKGEGLQGFHLFTSQNGTAHYSAPGNNTMSTSFGSTQQDMQLRGLRGSFESFLGFHSPKASAELYKRHVLAINGTVVEDHETLMGRTAVKSFRSSPAFLQIAVQFASNNIRKLLGRGHSG